MTEINMNRDGHEEFISNLEMELVEEFDAQNPLAIITAVRHIGDFSDSQILERLFPKEPDQQTLAVGPLAHVRRKLQIYPEEK